MINCAVIADIRRQRWSGGKGRGSRDCIRHLSLRPHTLGPSIEDLAVCVVSSMDYCLLSWHLACQVGKLSKLFSGTTAVFRFPSYLFFYLSFSYYLLVLLHFFRLCLSSRYFVCHLEKWMPLHALLKGTLKLRQLRIEGSSRDRRRKRERKADRERGMMIKGSSSHLSYYL